MRIAAILAVLLLAMIAFPDGALAQIERVDVGQTKTIDAHGVCKKVTNTGGASFPVFFNTAAEWTAFRNNKPGNASLAECGPTCGGTLVGGYCWYSNPFDSGVTGGDNCNTFCATRGGCNLAGMRNYAGSSGTNQNCLAVINALGIGGSSVSTVNGSTNRGCYKVINTVFRMTGSNTTCEGAPGPGFPGALNNRPCACND